MHILKAGKLPEDNIYTGTCQHCKCQVSFTQREARYSSDQRDGDLLTVKCPTIGCGHDIWVPVK